MENQSQNHKTENIAAVIDYIESHLREKLDLDKVAGAVHYSKFHLHRMFTDTVGITPHDYIQRRQLTEAAKFLVFSKKPIIEIALIAGYESQQAFTGIFKSMYKQTPAEYRERQVFYPLQLKFILDRKPWVSDSEKRKISYVTPEDIPEWMAFVALVIDGFPCFDEKSHLERLKVYVEQRQALIMRNGKNKDTGRNMIIGAAAFTKPKGTIQAGFIDFFGVHPQYRQYGVSKALLDFMMENVFAGREISITTFRQGDRADTGQREEYKRLGFVEAELLTEFGYPAQRMILAENESRNSDEWNPENPDMTGLCRSVEAPGWPIPAFVSDGEEVIK